MSDFEKIAQTIKIACSHYDSDDSEDSEGIFASRQNAEPDRSRDMVDFDVRSRMDLDRVELREICCMRLFLYLVSAFFLYPNHTGVEMKGGHAKSNIRGRPNKSVAKNERGQERRS